MKIKSAEVVKLNGVYNYKVNFNPDINIITGINGSGKSSFIKLIWYMISGNLERIPFEIEVSRAKVVTDSYSIEIEMSGGVDRESLIGKRTYSVVYSAEGKRREAMFNITRGALGQELAEINKYIGEHSGSLFFPTYRRIEWGGAQSSREGRRINSRHMIYGEESALEVIGSTLDRVSKEISVYNHRFITTTSVDDIISLLTEKYATISRVTNSIQNQLSEKIIGQIEKYDSEQEKDNSENLMNSIKLEIESSNKRRDRLMMPFSKFTELASNIIDGKKVRLTRFLTIGNDTSREVPSYFLSAGEKQMMSFLCYNALFEGIPFIIDEPELSLHTNWQRTLFPLLLEQSNNNQFIAVTHSPFIYSKYSDKEITFHKDRGNSEDSIPGFLNFKHGAINE